MAGKFQNPGIIGDNFAGSRGLSTHIDIDMTVVTSCSGEMTTGFRAVEGWSGAEPETAFYPRG
jgi:hypothetical protein